MKSCQIVFTGVKENVCEPLKQMNKSSIENKHRTEVQPHHVSARDSLPSKYTGEMTTRAYEIQGSFSNQRKNHHHPPAACQATVQLTGWVSFGVNMKVRDS